MVITYYGKAFIRLQFGDMVVALNPIAKRSEVKSARFGADIALISLRQPEFAGAEALNFGSKEPVVFDGPGEYELSDVFIKGYLSVGPVGKINTIYTIVLEGMKICHLGVLAENNLEPDVVEEISGANILFVPIGDEGTMAPGPAAKLASSLIPNIIIPVLDGAGKEADVRLAEFLKETGEAGIKRSDKLSLKKKDLEGKEAEVIPLEIT
ncbi:MAG: MBL fold metallo-hydrolase [Candidatus Paceibacterota bacterium]